ncbi:putative membrane protein YkoI [Bradyrhizobium sp. AZCC 2262]|uniref:PepSY domain-containing protein n=1 Tax=Bradyrhizobium sp. AZCC 2262 TaxID=3117022 RepID=UPI002FF14E93
MFDKQGLDRQMKLASHQPGRLSRWRAAFMAATVLSATGFALAGGAVAGEIKDQPRFKHSRDYSSLKDWNLKAENIVPHGANPLYYPIVPGHKHVHERPDHPDGKYRKETVVLDSTEDFDITGIGKFKTAVVQEEEYLDGVLTQRALNWFALDKTTNSVYAFGEVSWEIEEGKPVFAGTWRAGELDGDMIAEPGLLMPGTFTVGGRYLFDGGRVNSGGSENMEAGIEMTVPAGTFKNCVRVREQGLRELHDITDKIWCPVVGVVSDTSDGKLIVTNALPKDNPASDVSSVGTLRDKPLKYTPPVAKISGDQATKIALAEVPGKATSVTIERKKGKNVYVVEIQTPKDGEKDVFVDIESGKIVGTD